MLLITFMIKDLRGCTRTCRILIPFTIFEVRSFKNSFPGKSFLSVLL